MIKPILSVSRVAAITSIFVLIGFVIYGGSSVWASLKNDTTQYQRAVLERAFAFESDLLGFERDLNAFGSGIPTVGFEEVQARYVGLRRNLGELRSFGFAEAADGRGGAALIRLSQRLEAVEPIILGLQDTVDAQARALVVSVEMRSYLQAAQSITSDTTMSLGTHTEALDAGLRKSAEISVYLSALAALSGLVLIVWLLRDGFAAARLQDRNRHLASRAEVASRTKSSFLAMMSHDLRTPLNGLLGNVALARAAGLPERQERLLEQADRAGQRLNMFLSDVLDYAALQDASLAPERQDFEPRQLRDDLAAMIEDEARRHNVVVGAELAGTAHQRVTGDLRLLRQAISHVVIYLLETAGTKAVLLSYGVEDEELVVRLAFSYADGVAEAQWVPELVIGAPERSGEQVAQDAFGPALARALLDVLGGHILLDAQGDRAVSIVIRTGAQRAHRQTYRVPLDLQSRALRAMCQAGLSAPDVAFVPLEESAEILLDALIIDAGFEDDAPRVRALRERHPGAKIIGVGETQAAWVYDIVLPLPLAGAGLQDAVRAARAG